MAVAVALLVVPRAVLDFPSRLPVVSWLAPGGLHWFLGRVLVVISWRSPGCFCCRPWSSCSGPLPLFTAWGSNRWKKTWQCCVVAGISTNFVLTSTVWCSCISCLIHKCFEISPCQLPIVLPRGIPCLHAGVCKQCVENEMLLNTSRHQQHHGSIAP